MPCVSHGESVSPGRSLWCTYSVQVQVSQSVLQSVVVFPNGDLRLEPWGKSQPVTAAEEEASNVTGGDAMYTMHHKSLSDTETNS